MLLRVQAAGVDPGVRHLMTGLPCPSRLAFGLRKPKNPVRGCDGAGRVEAVGAKVTRFKPGDEVFGICDGSFAEYTRAKADRLVPRPATLTFEQAAALPTSGITALQSMSAVRHVRRRARRSSSSAPRAGWARTPSSSPSPTAPG